MSWQRVLLPMVGLACLVTLLLSCFGGVFLRGEQFAYRDAGHYYYPLYLRVQQQWESGHLPLWDSGENGGMPLLGNPTAAVLYPGKLVYALLPYPWAARAYVIAHVVLAALGAYLLARSLAIGKTGALLAGLAYAFGAPVLFMHSNVIYLVGAAWMPFGFRGADRWVRRGSLRGALELTLALALTTLGGDAEAAYLTAAFAFLYALGHGWLGPRLESSGVRPGWLVLGAGLAWPLVVLLLARWFPDLSPWREWGRWVRNVIWLALIAGIVVLAVRKRPVPWMARASAARVAGVVLAGGLAFLLAGAQVIPALESSSLSVRSASVSPFDPYVFSLEPWRLIELLWPNVTGTALPENRAWILALNPLHGQEFWTPSLYVGVVTVLLALSAMFARGREPGRTWMAFVVVVALLASFGRYGGPLWLIQQVPALSSLVMPPDALVPPERAPGSEDVFGSVYWAISALFPGFEAFRFPAKLMVPASLGVSVLAGIGWDRLLRGSRRPTMVLAAGFLLLGAAGLLLSLARQDAWLERWGQSADLLATLGGPLDARGALGDLRKGLTQGVVVSSFVLGLAVLAWRRPTLAKAGALLGLTIDLVLANAGLVWTAPQSVFDREPEVLRQIRDAEREDASSGPFRVHRMPVWYPGQFFASRSPNRIAEITAWERDTLQPGHGLPLGVDYVFSPGLLEPYEFVWFFRPMARPMDSGLANRLGEAPGRPVLYYPRRGVDLWNARYFVLPADPGDWLDESRGIAAYLDGARRIAPDLDELRRHGGEAEVARWRAEQDWQLLRNESAFPRAWVVHDARWIDPVDPTNFDELDRAMQRLLFQNDRLWNDPRRPVIDLRTTAWIESSAPGALAGFLARDAPATSEPVVVTTPRLGRVELNVELQRPGLVILADSYYPGWKLTIDGEPAPILRANRMMRGAAVPAGRHHLVYTYEPWSVRIGFVATAIGLVTVTGLSVLARRFGWAPGAGSTVQ